MRFEKGTSGNPNGRPKGRKNKKQHLNIEFNNILNFFRSFETNNTHYVYGHFNLINKECFYIGKGKENRAWCSDNRNDFWKNYTDKYPNYEIRLLVVGLSEQESLEIEKLLIKSRKPVCNKVHNLFN